MAQVNTSGGTSFSELKSAYVAGGLTDASGDASLKDGSTAIDLSYFRNANFTDGTSVPGSGAIRIGTRFINSDTGTGRTFGSSATTYYLQIDNEGTVNSFQYEILNISSMVSGNQGPNLLGTMFMASNSSGELEYTDTNNEITINITNSADSPVTVNNITAGMGLSVTETTPITGGVITLTLSDTGSSGSPLILGISTD